MRDYSQFPLCISCRTDRFLLMIPAFLLVFSAAAYRITTGLLIHSGATWLSNFTPLAAIALCSAAYFPRKYKFSVPLVTLFISDAVINFSYGAPLLDSQILVRYVALAVVGCAGLLLQNRASLKTLLPASIVGSIFFYGATNAFSWLSDPGYTKNLAGLIQALTTDCPVTALLPVGCSSAIRSSAIFLFTLLFVLSINLGRSAEGSRARAAVPRAA